MGGEGRGYPEKRGKVEIFFCVLEDCLSANRSREDGQSIFPVGLSCKTYPS